MGSYPPPPPYENQTIRQGPGSQPEILPPDTGYGPPPPPPVRRRRPSWAAAPATYLLVGINCAVFLVMVLSGVSIGNPTVEQLMTWGADNAGAVLLGGEWWRIVAAMFVHVGILHLATNMWCLWNLALLAEPLMGSLGVIAVYILTGAAGNLLSTLVNWVLYHNAPPGTGFPAGAGVGRRVWNRRSADCAAEIESAARASLFELKKLRRSVIYFAVLNLILGLSISGGNLFLHSGLNIDNMAHVGGFSCGLLFAVPMVPRIGSPRAVFQRRLQIAVIMTVGLLVMFGFFLAQLPG